MDNTLLTPHLGYATPEQLGVRYEGMVAGHRSIPGGQPYTVTQPGGAGNGARQVERLGQEDRWVVVEREKGWQERQDSNPRPSVLETDALPAELRSYG